MSTNALSSYVVLYRPQGQAAIEAPLGFQCNADDTTHAEEQCLDAYPDSDIVWVWTGPEGVGMQPALDDYYAG